MKFNGCALRNKKYKRRLRRYSEKCSKEKEKFQNEIFKIFSAYGYFQFNIIIYNEYKYIQIF